MLSHLDEILQDECQIGRGAPILVAVSGGADSLCVADILHRSGYSIIVAHFDHKLREESSSEAEIVRGFAQERALQFAPGEGVIQALVGKVGSSIEEAAREARYRFLFQYAEKINAQAVVVGHTADDQVETFLMHLLRGSGLDGLTGMPYRWLPNAWHDRIPLVRPLLGVWRDETLAYCEQNNLTPIFDPTNQDVTFFRNRLRLELIPYLETYNPAARKLFWQTTRVLAGERETVRESVEDAWDRVLSTANDQFVSLNVNLCNQYPLGVQRRLIRRAIAQLRPGLRDISFEAVEHAVEQLKAIEPYAEADLIAGLRMVSENGLLWITEWDAILPTGDWPQVKEDHSVLEVGSTVELRGGWLLTAEFMEIDQSTAREFVACSDQAWLDLESIQSPLQVRSRKGGDRFQPTGMGGRSQKITDFMINQKMPRRARDEWPLVCSADRIAWVAGYRTAYFCRITDRTRQVVKLSLVKETGENQ